MTTPAKSLSSEYDAWVATHAERREEIACASSPAILALESALALLHDTEPSSAMVRVAQERLNDLSARVGAMRAEALRLSRA